jgi:hypothetical protein
MAQQVQEDRLARPAPRAQQDHKDPQETLARQGQGGQLARPAPRAQQDYKDPQETLARGVSRAQPGLKVHAAAPAQPDLGVSKAPPEPACTNEQQTVAQQSP